MASGRGSGFIHMIEQADLQAELNKLKWKRNNVFRLQEPVHLSGPGPLRIEGCFLEGWWPCAPQWPNENQASIVVTNAGTHAIEVIGPSAGLYNHSILHPNQSKSRPIMFPWAVKGRGSNIFLKNITFVSASHMIHLTDGQHEIEGIRGQILGSGVGIQIEEAHDTIWMNKIHFWPLWNARPEFVKYSYWEPGGDKEIKGNGRAFVMKNVDWIHADQITVFGCHVGFQTTGKCDLAGGSLQFDAVSVPVDLYHVGDGGFQIANLRVGGNRHWGGWSAIPVLGHEGLHAAVQIGSIHAQGDFQKILWESHPQLLQVGNAFPRNRLL